MVGTAEVEGRDKAVFCGGCCEQEGDAAADLSKQSSGEEVVGVIAGKGEKRGTGAYQ